MKHINYIWLLPVLLLFAGSCRQDLRKVKTCPVHQSKLIDYTAQGIGRGFTVSEKNGPGYDQACAKQFPHAKVLIVPDTDGSCLLNYCPKCEDAKWAWTAKHFEFDEKKENGTDNKKGLEGRHSPPNQP